MKEINLSTTKRNDMIDITSIIEENLSGSGVVTIFVPHTTAAVTINENADPDVEKDMLRKLSELIPKEDDYNHLEGNSDSHLKASLFGNSLQIIFKDGKLVLGTWQGVFFCEFDGPRKRKIWIKY